MVLHLPHTEGGFGVTFNNVTKDAVFYTTTSSFVVCLGTFSQERQKLWSTKNDLQDSTSWSTSPLVLRDMHNNLLVDYDCKDTTPPQSQPGTGDSVVSANRTTMHNRIEGDRLLLSSVTQ
jgi:hypothetical protein